MTAVFQVEQAGPLVSVQDRGRIGFKRYGVAGTGPMDRLGLELCNFALGREGSAIEVSLGGLTLKCVEGRSTVAVCGGAFRVLLDGREMPPWSLFVMETESVLQIRPGKWGNWCYLGFAGDIVSDRWLGSASVHFNSGLCGAPYVTGDRITVENPKVIGEERLILDPELVRPTPKIRAVRGPQDRFFEPRALEAIFSTEYKLTAEYSRMGVRLDGEKLNINRELDMPSEAVGRGSLQVPGHGSPICLLADHQSAGGYPKIATVISVDQDRLAQLKVGEPFRFEEVTTVQAIEIARKENLALENLKNQITENAGGLTARLWANNLISGAISETP